MGASLEVPRDASWGIAFTRDDFQRVADAGFDFVRLPVAWSRHTAKAPPFRIQEDILPRVDGAIRDAFASGLAVILDVHHYRALNEDPEGEHDRYLSIWRQIAERYRVYPSKLSFELLNEPSHRMKAPLWNRYLMEALAIIRETNPEREVVVGSAGSNSVDQIRALALPAEDRHITVTFHYYRPAGFTHQGANWVSRRYPVGRAWRGTEAERNAVVRAFDSVAAWAVAQRRPVLLGEFGVYFRADAESRSRWTRFIRMQAVEHGFGWAYWTYAGQGFGAYDNHAGRWRKDLRAALLGD